MTAAIEKLYIHYADFYHTNRARKNGVSEPQIRQALSRSLRIAILFSDEVVFPASSVFESANCRALIEELPHFRDSGVIRMAAGDPDLTTYLSSKLKAFNATSPKELLRSYRTKHKVGLPSYDEKTGSSTKAITELWKTYGEDENFTRQLFERNTQELPKDHLATWNDLPNRLEGLAFIPAHALDVLVPAGFNATVAPAISIPIECAYIEGYADALGADLLIDIPFLSWRHLEQRFQTTHCWSCRKIYEKLAQYKLLNAIEVASSDSLFRLRVDPEWRVFSACLLGDCTVTNIDHTCKHLLSILETDFQSTPSLFGSQPVSEPIAENSDIRTAILTALPKEFAAVRSLLTDEERHKQEGDPNAYYIGTAFKGTTNEVKVVVCLLTRMGNEAASTACANLIRSFATVENIAFCGIALGIPNVDDPDKHVRLGDVVISDRQGVIQTDFVARKPGEDQNRSQLPPPPQQFVQALNLMEADLLLEGHGWAAAIDSIVSSNAAFARPADDTDVVVDNEGNIYPHPDQAKRIADIPMIHRGKIGSSDVLVKDAKYRDEMAAEHGIVAMEMEGAGALEASWSFGKSAMIVRGISDYGAGKNDLWQEYASLAAAVATFALIERL